MPRPCVFLLALLAAGCIREPAEPTPEATPDARPGDARPLLEPPPDAAPRDVPDARLPDAAPDGEPHSAPGPVICGPEHPFDRALAAALTDPERVACRDGRDCVEVEPCPGEFCFVGEAVNREAAAAIDALAPPDERCEDCGPAGPPECPEPEPPFEDCFEGFCQMGFGAEPVEPPVDCDDARVKWQRAVRAAAEGVDSWCEDATDCTVLSFANGCADCDRVTVRRDRAAIVQARIAAHLEVNDCALCGGGPIDCDPVGVRCDVFCVLED